MKNFFIFNFLYFIQETINQKIPGNTTDGLGSIPLPKTLPEAVGVAVFLLLSPATLGVAINAWANKSAIKDAKTKELEKTIAEKNDANNKKDIQIEILKVKLENSEKNCERLTLDYERRIQFLSEENKNLKEMTNTGFTRQEEIYREQIKKLESKIEDMNKKNQ